MYKLLRIRAVSVLLVLAMVGYFPAVAYSYPSDPRENDTIQNIGMSIGASVFSLVEPDSPDDQSPTREDESGGAKESQDEQKAPAAAEEGSAGNAAANTNPDAAANKTPGTNTNPDASSSPSESANPDSATAAGSNPDPDPGPGEKSASAKLAPDPHGEEDNTALLETADENPDAPEQELTPRQHTAHYRFAYQLEELGSFSVDNPIAYAPGGFSACFEKELRENESLHIKIEDIPASAIISFVGFTPSHIGAPEKQDDGSYVVPLYYARNVYEIQLHFWDLEQGAYSLGEDIWDCNEQGFDIPSSQKVSNIKLRLKFGENLSMFSERNYFNVPWALTSAGERTLPGDTEQDAPGNALQQLLDWPALMPDPGAAEWLTDSDAPGISGSEDACILELWELVISAAPPVDSPEPPEPNNPEDPDNPDDPNEPNNPEDPDNPDDLEEEPPTPEQEEADTTLIAELGGTGGTGRANTLSAAPPTATPTPGVVTVPEGQYLTIPEPETPTIQLPLDMPLVPAAGTRAWAASNLLLLLLNIVPSLVLTVGFVLRGDKGSARGRRKPQDAWNEEAEAETAGSNFFASERYLWRAVSTTLACLGIVQFASTQDFTLPVVVFDKASILMTVLFVAQAALVVAELRYWDPNKTATKAVVKKSSRRYMTRLP
jgi:hypothetical protein